MLIKLRILKKNPNSLYKFYNYPCDSTLSSRLGIILYNFICDVFIDRHIRTWHKSFKAHLIIGLKHIQTPLKYSNCRLLKMEMPSL